MLSKTCRVGRCAPGRACRLVLLTGLCALPRLAAAEMVSSEIREFHIAVDGDRCGTYRLAIDDRPDGRAVIRGDAALELNYVVYKFRYTSKGTETWRDDQLEKLENAATYGKKSYQVNAAAAGDHLAVKINGKEQRVPADAWVSSYWREPAAELVGKTLNLLDADKGRALKGKLEHVGVEPLKLRGDSVDCDHYRLTGDVQVDVWYDPSGRLSRQESVESGHRTLLELKENAP